MPSSNTGRLHAILLIRNHSFFGLTAPAFAAPAQPAKEAAVPVQTAATSSYSGNAKTRIFHVSGCRYFNCKACTVRFKSAEEARSNGYKPCKRCLAREGK